MTAPTEDPVADFFASSSVAEHVFRGVLGLLLAVGAVVLAPTHPWALLGLIGTVLAWRGCPTCWTLGLLRTLSRGRAGCACSEKGTVMASSPRLRLVDMHEETQLG